MLLTITEELLWRIHERWRTRLLEAEMRMKQDRNAGTKAEYMRVLRTFKNLVMYRILPRE